MILYEQYHESFIIWARVSRKASKLSRSAKKSLKSRLNVDKPSKIMVLRTEKLAPMVG